MQKFLILANTKIIQHEHYWQCLGAHTQDAALCPRLRSSFETSCPQQWRKYFDKRRDYLKFKEKFEAEQFQPSESTTNF
uniref:Cytochrome c oxidase assembly factor 6 homolog n=1 Tax=Sciurus vulgaris TaxID=55149 RepID=A0A8D2CXU9_SCIVU